MNGCGKRVRAMRCMACGEEMRVVQVVPDDTMPVPGYEHHTLECPACHEVERRLVFIRETEPIPFEPRSLPPLARQDEVTASTGGAATVGASINTSINTSINAWARALDRLRIQQASLQERQALAKVSAAADQFRRDRDEIVRSHHPRPAIAIMTKGQNPPSQSNEPDSADGARRHKAPSSAMARVIARLRRRGAWQTVDRSSDANRNFDRMWESFAPDAPSRAAAPSRSLVPVALPAGEACDETWSTWARAMTLLRGDPQAALNSVTAQFAVEDARSRSR
jgi:hypothetical protein